MIPPPRSSPRPPTFSASSFAFSDMPVSTLLNMPLGLREKLGSLGALLDIALLRQGWGRRGAGAGRDSLLGSRRFVDEMSPLADRGPAADRLHRERVVFAELFEEV